MDADGIIDGNTKFYAERSGETITIDELLEQSIICLESFLLGLWHYCIVEVKKNSIGQETYVGEDSDRRVELTYCMPSNFMDYEEKKTSDEDEEPESEVLDAVLEHEEQSAQPNLKQNINNLVIFNLTQNQYGNGKMFEYVEDYHEKDED